MKPFSTALRRLIGEGAFVVLQKARELEAQGKNIIHLEIGEPDFDTPQHIKQACVRYLMEENYTHYTPSVGLREVREAVARYVSETRGVPVQYTEVAITPGAKAMIFAALIALVDVGDEVILPNPAYPAYESGVRFMGGIPVFVPLLEEKGFEMDLDELRSKITERTKLIVLNSPANPTGGVLPREALEVIAELAQEHDLWVLSDEIYRDIVYEEEAPSILSLPGMKERTILIDGLSKSFAMTGWRLGYGVMPEALVEEVSLVLNNAFSCANAFVQMSTIDALFGPKTEVEKMVAEFRRRRDAIVDALNEIPGVRCNRPKGAFYVFPNVKAFGKSSAWLADYLLQNAHVALLAGTDFGIYGEGYLRLSYANSLENILEGVRRIREALARLPRL